MKKYSLILLIALTSLLLASCKKDRGYVGLDRNVEGEITVMLWSGDGSYIEDIGHKDFAPDELFGQNQATVYAVAKAFNQIYPNVKINVYAKTEGPDDDDGSWFQHRENFKNQYGKWPDIYASTDLAGDIGRGLVADLSRFKDDPLYKQLNPALMKMMNYYGFQAGLPQYILPWGVYVNKELAEQNNIDVPDPDWTMDEYIEFIEAAPGGDKFYGAMDVNMSFFNTGTTTINASLYNYDGTGDHVNINSEEVRTLLTKYYKRWAENAVWAISDAGRLPDGFGDSFGWWSHLAFARNKVLTNDGDPWMMGDAAHPNPEHANRVQSNDWDIYPRPATDYQPNTVGVVLDPIAVHNYCIDDGNPECTEEEEAKIKLAYTFAIFWIADTRAWQARADVQFLDNGVLKSCMNDSLPVVVGEEFHKQMEIWYSVDIHQRFKDKDKMPGWHYVLELWEKGQVWDVSDKAYPMYFTDDSGQRKLNLHEWQNANTVEVAELIGVDTTLRRLDPQFVQKLIAKLPEWNQIANERFKKGDQELRTALKTFYGYTDKDFEK